jgi:hypothetical protein
MGYFSNATQHAIWATKNCHICQHNPDDYDEDPIGCPVEFLHMQWNYDDVNERDNPKPYALDIFIPPNGIYNGQCRMLIKKEEVGQ